MEESNRKKKLNITLFISFGILLILVSFLGYFSLDASDLAIIKGKREFSSTINKEIPDTISAYFIGNSYTYCHDLPSMIAELAKSTSTKDVFLHDQTTIGGYSLKSHWTNPTTIAKFSSNTFDFVILQENSTAIAKEEKVFQSETFPYVHKFDSLRSVVNPTAQTVLYMTWGHKNGNASLCAVQPINCTYLGMDSLVRVRYRKLQSENNSLIVPVGLVRNYLRRNHPQLELYDPDGSHPTPIAAYAAACCFYTVLFEKDPMLCNYSNSIPPETSKLIREATKKIVFDSLSYWRMAK